MNCDIDKEFINAEYERAKTNESEEIYQEVVAEFKNRITERVIYFRCSDMLNKIEVLRLVRDRLVREGYYSIITYNRLTDLFLIMAIDRADVKRDYLIDNIASDLQTDTEELKRIGSFFLKALMVASVWMLLLWLNGQFD